MFQWYLQFCSYSARPYICYNAMLKLLYYLIFRQRDENIAIEQGQVRADISGSCRTSVCGISLSSSQLVQYRFILLACQSSTIIISIIDQ